MGLPEDGVFMRDGFPCRWEATAVVDRSVDQCGMVECGFAGSWNISA